MRHRRLFASLTRQPRPRGGIYEEDGRGAEALNGRISPAGSSRGVLPSQSRTRRIAPSAQGSGHPVPGLEIDALTCAHHDRARQTGSTLPAPRTALPAPRTEASGRGPEAGLLTALGDLTERCPACLGASSSVECRTAEFSRSFRSRRRLAAPLARRQRPRAQPWQARPGRTPGHIPPGHADQDGSTAHCPCTAWGRLSRPDCPAHSRSVNGDPTGRRTRSATPTIDPAATHQDSAPARKMGGE